MVITPAQFINGEKICYTLVYFMSSLSVYDDRTRGSKQTQRKMPPKQRKNRYKIRCLECKPNVEMNFDYKNRHNSRFHRDLLEKRKKITYEVVGAPKNPFVATKKKNSTQIPDEVPAIPFASVSLKKHTEERDITNEGGSDDYVPMEFQSPQKKSKIDDEQEESAGDDTLTECSSAESENENLLESEHNLSQVRPKNFYFITKSYHIAEHFLF